MTPSKHPLAALTALTTVVLLASGLWAQSTLGDRLLPHSFCITASPALLWLHVAGDGLIALSYLLIPLAMLNVVRKRADIPFGWIAWLFGAFILACGTTHAMEVWTLWEPVYWYSGVLKAFTAMVSLGTAWVLYRLTPQLLDLPSATQLRSANAALEREIASRRSTEAALTRAKNELEDLLGKTTEQAQKAALILDRFFDVAPVGMLLVSESGHIARLNKALLAAAARPESDYLGQHFEQIAGLPARAVDSVRTVRDTRQTLLNVDVSRTGPDGDERHLVASYFPIPLPSGSLLIGTILQDVSAQWRSEQARSEALARAEEANRAKDQFLAKVSHELRSPLQVALSSAEVLKRMPELSTQGRKFVDRLAHAVGMQARMINDLLDLSRILSGKLHVVNETVDPALPLLRILEHWTATALAQGVRLDAGQLNPGQALVQADPSRLEQVFANLIENAIRFSPNRGDIVLGAHTSRTRWRFFVRDFGAGMSAEDTQRVFEPFVQGAAQPRTGKGLGLGLAIVSSLVEAFGGRVWAESAGVGLGCTFRVELPLVMDDSAPSSGFAEMHDTVRLDGLLILYVEDEVDVAAAMQDGLVRLGARVEVANSFDEAIAQLERLDVNLDVVVTDLNLGQGKSGADIAEAMRSMARHARVPIIAVSAFGGAEDRVATRHAGFGEHLVKPVGSSAVAEAVRRVLRA